MDRIDIQQEPEIDIVVKGNDENYYLAKNFTQEELSWVWWKDASYFRKLDVIPENVQITEVILRWRIQSAVEELLLCA
ncbi:MAG: hypothetical protein ACD_78C00417G0008 [uncultured bacterium (gcode 4)]|uniref:Uncharacterized protein n=1 Tax=uncultured bacterium (gcode 4) TaxID=1234023 RepID=K1XGL5_9BACT|nr:MAG: hypothetical protein ACD_78C00417G0008 [uncultured bacterium (gcode 4)]